jgi:hypothetical protein
MFRFSDLLKFRRKRNLLGNVVLLLEFQVGFVQLVDTIDHLLDQLDFGVTETVLVGDVVGVAGLAARFTAGTAGLQVEFFALGLQLVDAFGGPAGQVDVDGGAHAGAQVGGARVDVAELLRVLEVLAGFGLDGVLDGLDTTGKALEDLLDVAARLHGDDAELIFLVDPDKEGLVLVVEDTTAFGPVTLHTSDLQVGITRHEEEVIIDKLLASGLVHASQWVVSTSQITFQLGESVLHEGLNIDTLLLGDTGGKAETLDGAADTDPSRVDGHIGFNVASDLARVHVRDVLEVSRETMVLADEGVEDLSEVSVGILITSIDTTMLVVELNGAGNSLGQGELGGLADNARQLVPLFLGDVLGNQGVLGFDIRECGHGFC